ncbi:MAG: VOC family protein [Candidatus Zixiibacteriota bacterium]|nr:MAG: VOC family protein [candidate division Zixibacteria bacterium]
MDLTVPQADRVRDFYAAVTGWQVQPVPMDGYDDYAMVPPETQQAVAGICHARGANAGLPPQWLIYITVADLDESLRRCRELGGEVVFGPRPLGQGRFAVIRDPAGAVAAVYEEKQ